MIKTILVVLFSVLSASFSVLYHAHMFQLNGYKNNEQRKWLRKHLDRQWPLLLAAAAGIFLIFIDSVFCTVLTCVFLAFIASYFWGMTRQSQKKKMVFTPRMKRLLFALAAVMVFVVLAAFLLFGHKGCRAAACIMAAISPLLVIICNIINQPIEQHIRNGFIQDAKNKLQSMPDLTIIGVTGSYGKTSVKFYLQTLLEEKYRVLVTPESYNTPMGVVKTIREQLKPTHNLFICEMGARYVGDIQELCDIVHPNHGVITAIGPQHLETFLNIDNIIDTKFELAEALPQNGQLFLNSGNDYIRTRLEKYPKAIRFNAFQQNDGYGVEDLNVTSTGTYFTVKTPTGESESFFTKLVGSYNVSNVLCAITVAHQMGIPLHDLRSAVRRIRPVNHRMELIPRGQVTLIDDAYNSNPAGSKAALETLALFDGVHILVTPGMVELGEREEELNAAFGEYAASSCDYILLVGGKRVAPIREGALRKGFPEDRCRVFPRLEEALSYAYSILTDQQKIILLENDLPDNY